MHFFSIIFELTLLSFFMQKLFIYFLISLFTFANGFSSTSNLSSLLQQIKNAYNVAGMTVFITKGNSSVFAGNYGYSDILRNLPVNDSTVFRIASISKTVTAAAMMKLYEQGLVDLDADISNYLNFTLRNPFYPNDTITLRKILSHTGSLRDGSTYNSFLNASYSQNPPPHLQNLLVPGGAYYSSSMYSSSKQPSSNYFVYSNINYGVIATVVEKVTNVRFDIYCRNNILLPLGLSASFVVNDLPNINNVSVLYRFIGNTWVPQADDYNGVMPPPRDLSSYIIGSNAVIFGPQGSLRISASDLSVFMRALKNGGIYNMTRILNDTTVNRMLTPQWLFDGTNGNSYNNIFMTYGLGTHRTRDLLVQDTLFGHPGEAYGLISDMYFSGSRDYGIILIANGGVWSNGVYSGWYNLEEEVFQACYNNLDSLLTIVSNEDMLPVELILEQNYPNPFNSSSRIKFTVPFIRNHSAEKIKVTLKVYDTKGCEIAELMNDYLEPGAYERSFSLLNYHSGAYIYKLTAGELSKSRVMIYLK